MSSAQTRLTHLWNVSRNLRCTRVWTRRRASDMLPCAPAVDDKSRSQISLACVRSAKSGAQNTARGSGSPEKPTFHTRDPGLPLEMLARKL